MSKSKKFYEDELGSVAKKITEAGMGVFFCVYREGEMECLHNVCEDSPFVMRLVNRAAACGGNVDDLILWLLKAGREEGHQSVCLKALEASASAYVRSGS